jgi:thiol:disulfide interchange protein
MKKTSLAVALCFLAGSSRALAPSVAPSVYDEKADAPAAVAAAVGRAAAEHKRVLVDFGANWCGDCLALDRNFHRPENGALLEADFVLVHADIGRFDKNTKLAARYGVPLKKGVPALVVLDEKGRVVYAQKKGEFESMRSLDPAAVHAFLVKWKAPKAAGAPDGRASTR